MTHQESISPVFSIKPSVGGLSRLALASVGLALGLVAATPAVQAQTSLLHETFDHGPTDSTWHFSRGSEYVTIGSGSAAGTVAYNTNSGDGAFQNLVTYFTAPGQQVTLGVGQSISVSLKFSVEPLSSGSGEVSLRLGLYNSSASSSNGRVGEGAQTSYNNYRGYSVYLDTKRITKNSIEQSPVALYRRVGGNGQLGNTGTAHAAIGSRDGSWDGATSFGNLESYVANFVITRTSESEVSIGLEVTGGGLSGYSASWTAVAATADGIDYTKFDTLALVVGNGTSFQNVIFDEVSIGMIPEPKSVALWIGAFGIAMCVGLRRKRG